jgi:murein DD-endopeptidase MepM/ murein hydrolase activator NlpD
MTENAPGKPLLHLLPRPHLILLGSLFFLFFISKLLGNIAGSTQQIIPLDFSPRSAEEIDSAQLPEQSLQLSRAESRQWQEEKVRSGDTLSTIFQRAGIPSSTLHEILTSGKEAASLTKLIPGHQLRFSFDKKGVLEALQYTPSPRENLEIIRLKDNHFSFSHIRKKPEIAYAYKRATIEGSLFGAGQKAGISQGMIMQVANVFSGVIDFALDPRKGDTFDLFYEEEYIDGNKVGNGRLLAASYNGRDEKHTAYLYTFADGHSAYFSPEGISMTKPFLRAPLDFTRISSGFNLKRMHPIHKKIKAHRGLDYVAPRGTPIFSVADGKVAKSGYSPANGNFVFISHGAQYMTKYLHLDRRFVKTGQRIRQRTVIGTLGSTGYSTGPHLHYEFLINGVHRDPKTVYKQLPRAETIPKQDKARFQQQISAIKLRYRNHQYAMRME